MSSRVLRRLVPFCLILLLAAGLWAQAKPADPAPAAAPAAKALPADWKTYSYSDDGFSVSFPSAPAVSSQEVPTKSGSFQLRSYMVDADAYALFAGVTDYGSLTEGVDPKVLLGGARDGAVENTKAHLIRQREITLGTAPGLEFEAESDTMHFYARVYLVGNTLYQVLVVSPLTGHYPETARFLDSFQLIPRTAKSGQ